MFKKKTRTMNPNTTDTLIGEGTIFDGRIKSEAGIRVEGHITGNVESEGDVTVGENGSVKSNIAARNVLIAGTVHGNIATKGSVRIMSTGKLYGNTTTQSLIIEEGGLFQGNSRVETAGSTAPATETQQTQQSQQQQHPDSQPFASTAPSTGGQHGSPSSPAPAPAFGYSSSTSPL
ncbi:polymer-forming cytoskeletal protein [Paenibacillus hemerocallicola]|uniref:Polymer-forming cytoskeletal protein n=1 Tax=Paenibacillus hemerocallicola TaxID=1172614 RepID=A0A5C4T6S3_9BACL|nr:polymer-forming cytoskeletal protein [Paenibacillus hemerocallicola]TNJ64525.1 polymer-forming cytoskeletal protein [Paenibacillus hemerocallicola]